MRYRFTLIVEYDWGEESCGGEATYTASRVVDASAIRPGDDTWVSKVISPVQMALDYHLMKAGCELEGGWQDAKPL